MRELDVTWSSVSSSGGQTPVHVLGDVMQSVWLFRGSTGVATATVRVESGFTESGPWIDEGGSTALTSGACASVRITGPFAYVRPWVNSTGISVRVVGTR